MAEIKVKIDSCEQCPYAQVEQVYTADSFEHVRNVRCKALNKVVHYLDTWDKSPIPSYCPIKVEKNHEPKVMIMELSEKEVEAAVKYYLEHAENMKVKSVKINVGQGYVGFEPNETLTAKFKNARCEVEK